MRTWGTRIALLILVPSARTASLPALVALGALGFGGCGSKPASGGALMDEPDAGPDARQREDAGARDARPSDASVVTDSRQVADVGPPPPDPCVDAGTCPPGAWISVTPSAIDLVDALDCSNFGTKTVQVDPLHPGTVYTLFFCQGLWKSTDYGLTWTGPINTGANGTTAGDCAGGIAIPASMPPGTKVPTIYEACIRGDALGFWRSTNGGVDWTTYPVLPDGGVATAVNQQFYPPVVDPYDSAHLLMAGHEEDLLVESTNGGESWTAVTTDPKMSNPGGTGGPEFVDTGDPATTRTTWLWLASATNLGVGTWRTTSGGGAWTQVDLNEHTNGANGTSLTYQPDNTSGILYMAGLYAGDWSGVLRSEDYGQTWQETGLNAAEAVVFGTKKNIYAMYGWAIGAGAMVDPTLEVGAQPGTGTWTMPATPGAMTQGPAEAAVTFDGTHSIVIVANYNAGLWRYVEP
jgi:hypothetical protein